MPSDQTTLPAIGGVSPAQARSDNDLETLEKGYTLGDTVLRPARVVVSE